MSHRRLPILFDAEAGIDISRVTVAELLSEAYSKSIPSLVTPNLSWPQPYLLWLRRAMLYGTYRLPEQERK